jgi:serine/threonine protein phosphatase PrpC
LKKCATLHAIDNKIEFLPKGIKMMNLSDLRMNCNNLKEIPDELFEIFSLQRLYFSNNQIKVIPKGMENLKNLTVLQIEGNKLKEIPNEIVKNQQLQMLFIGDNELTELPFDISTFPRLGLFSAWGNDLKKFNLKNPPKCLKSINISHNMNLEVDLNEIKKISNSGIQINANWCSKTTDYYIREYYQIEESRLYRVGTFDMIGMRPTMEDAMCFKGTLTETTNLWGIFDGHGGEKSSKFISEKLPEIIIKNLEQSTAKMYLQNPSIFIEKFNTYSELSFKSVDVLKKSLHEVNEELRKQKYEDGSTAVLVMISGNELTIANVGDSRAVLCKNGKAMRLTNDHRPTTDEEQHRIQEIEGIVMCNRIQGYSVSRSLGDFSASPFISAEPYLKTFQLEGDEDFLIIGCDGVWDDLSDEEAVESVKENIKETSHDIFHATTKLVNLAFSKGSKDNISAIIIDLKKK